MLAYMMTQNHFQQQHQEEDVEAKPTVEGEPVKEAPKSNNNESQEDVPF